MTKPALRILLVKTSSLGDVVHNLPVVEDLRAAFPGVVIDWVVEEAFAAIPRLHPGVSQVLPVAVRRWRRRLWHPATWREISDFTGALRAQRYDAIIDTHGLLKSAWIARLARGLRHGLDHVSAREPLGLFYDHVYRVPWDRHAVERNRSLAAQALGHALPASPRYGLRIAAQPSTAHLPAAPYAMLLHATSAERKLWPEARWAELGHMLAAQSIRCVLPWGTVAEHARSIRLARAIPQAVVPEHMALDALAALLAGAQVVAGTDTGLTHLAGALGVPTLGIYCATDPAATGLYGCARAINIGGVGTPPTAAAVCVEAEQLLSA